MLTDWSLALQNPNQILEGWRHALPRRPCGTAAEQWREEQECQGAARRDVAGQRRWMRCLFPQPLRNRWQRGWLSPSVAPAASREGPERWSELLTGMGPQGRLARRASYGARGPSPGSRRPHHHCPPSDSPSPPQAVPVRGATRPVRRTPCGPGGRHRARPGWGLAGPQAAARLQGRSPAASPESPPDPKPPRQ